MPTVIDSFLMNENDMKEKSLKTNELLNQAFNEIFDSI